jgi:hypothetical protein
MPAYGATPDQGVTLAPGNQIQLINAADATAGNVTTTIAVALGPTAGFTPTLTIINTTGQTATVAVAAQDTNAAAYQPLTDGDTTNAITVATGKAISFTCAAPFLLCTFASAPTTGLLAICR